MLRRLTGLSSLVVLLFLICGVACAGSLPVFDAATVPDTPDYADDTAWLTRPANPGEHLVDVFWVYPTVLHDAEHWLMDTASPEMKKSAQPTLVRQAGVFDQVANIYAPMYRQMNMAALSLSKSEQDRLIAYGMQDVWNALQYYLKHDNNGRPFILAGHSQGSNILVNLMVKHWGSIGAESRLVAGYTIGWSITRDDLAKNRDLRICTSAEQTGCFVTYNTVAAGRQKVAPTLLKNSVAVNPLNWRTDGEFAPASMNMGAKFFMDDGSVKDVDHFTSAQVVDGGVVVQPKDPALVAVPAAVFPEGVYHQFDYSLFWNNLRQNSARRIEVFLAGQN
ncbi:DUF3089 domain-containing protein [uncultured Pseudodesulfovibrio sp.]|uniref:DUF3089 domain-containing protein n=1 Tax=uncultured Pseudodesulfovibrio sp. TaxID=2035858 RepID=UPI0029C6AA0D|nr:DUF3089 domain-containing protein [uncultured Pseudodesulfovibrio sp.]